MVRLLTAFPVLLFFYATAFSQPPTDTAFRTYANNQSNLLHKSYEQKDTKQYEVLLTDFLIKFRALSKTDQSAYKGYLNNAYYNLSCTYSLLNDKKNALIYLDSSVKNGYYNYAHMMYGDADLVNIRQEAQFKKIVEPTREISDYRYILTKADKYNTADARPLPVFTYQSASNPDLVSLRKAFKLDSVAGKGNEVSRIINLLHWIHNLVPHDGNNGNPAVMNAMNMIAVCKKEGRGLNCRGLSTVLNECYLSLGIKSRFVTCLPKDSLKIDNDCHVINMVYVNSLKKWIWIDPTNDAYVMNEKGELLGIDEVRERIIKNQPLIVNPDANWNHKESTLKENYLYQYMAKNLYILECPVNSEYDTETRIPGKKISYVQLLPLDYFLQTPDKTESTNKDNGTTFIKLKTNNPAAFWQVPN